MARYPGFVGPAYTAQSKIAAADDLVNLFVERNESGTGKAPYVALSAPGYTPFCTLPTSPVRGMTTLNGATFAVGGGSLYQLPFTLGGSPRLIGSGLHNPDDSFATISGNGDAGGDQLYVTSGSKGYAADLRASTVTQVNDGPTQGAFMDAYFIALNPSRSEITLSALEDGTTWDPLDTAQRSDTPDKFLALLVNHKELWFFGSQTTAVYYNNGDSDFPFVTNPSQFITKGISAPWAAALLDGSPIWPGNGVDGGCSIYWAQGYTPVRVSTHAVEYSLSQLSAAVLSGAEGFSYQERGHSFYALNVPGAVCWVFDATTKLWHRRTSIDGMSLAVRGHAYANGVHLVGSRTSGVIYQMSADLFTDIDGSGLRRLRRAPHLTDEGRRATYDSLRIDAEVGIGLTSGQGSDPQGMLRWSDDGGQTWSNVYTASFGPRGAFRTRAIWRRLYGRGDDRVFEFSYSEPTSLTLIDAYLEMRAGIS